MQESAKKAERKRENQVVRTAISKKSKKVPELPEGESALKRRVSNLLDCQSCSSESGK